MSVPRLFLLAAISICLSLALGCEGDSDSGGGATGSYAGTWTGNVCGRGLTMNMSQNGTSLSGSYAMTDPDFSESMSGTVSSGTPPATATLNGGGDRRFEITFSSDSSLSGGYYKGSTKVCDVSATK